jgi:hypothetical protein
MVANCGNPHDRVYAMVGLFPPGVAELIEPDYVLAVGEVYKQMMLKIIEATKQINIGNRQKM